MAKIVKCTIEVGKSNDWWWSIRHPKWRIEGSTGGYRHKKSAVRAARKVAAQFGLTVTRVVGWLD